MGKHIASSLVCGAEQLILLLALSPSIAASIEHMRFQRNVYHLSAFGSTFRCH